MFGETKFQEVPASCFVLTVCPKQNKLQNNDNKISIFFFMITNLIP